MSYYDDKPPKPPAWAFLAALTILTILYYLTGANHEHNLLLP
jgi:hypothetical protein